MVINRIAGSITLLITLLIDFVVRLSMYSYIIEDTEEDADFVYIYRPLVPFIRRC